MFLPLWFFYYLGRLEQSSCDVTAQQYCSDPPCWLSLYLCPWAQPAGSSLLISAKSSAVNLITEATAFLFKCSGDLVPGIGTMFGARDRTQASARASVVQPHSLANFRKAAMRLAFAGQFSPLMRGMALRQSWFQAHEG